jgi:hypothetical protein
MIEATASHPPNRGEDAVRSSVSSSSAKGAGGFGSDSSARRIRRQWRATAEGFSPCHDVGSPVPGGPSVAYNLDNDQGFFVRDVIARARQVIGSQRRYPPLPAIIKSAWT